MQLDGTIINFMAITVGAETFLDTVCPPGRYCPPGTQHADEYLCPSSTYYNLTGAKEEADCVPCPGG